MMYIIPNFLVLHFGENFMIIRTEIGFHSHFYTYFLEFLLRTIEATSILLQLYTANFLYSDMVFNHFKIVVQFF